MLMDHPRDEVDFREYSRNQPARHRKPRLVFDNLNPKLVTSGPLDQGLSSENHTGSSGLLDKEKQGFHTWILLPILYLHFYA